MRRWDLIVGTWLLISSLTGCQTPSAPATTPTALPAEPIRIGVVTSISGPLAAFGQASLQGYTLALQDINASGGVQGRPVQLIFEDDGSDPRTAAAAVEKLATTDRVLVVLGPYSSSAALLAAGMAERHQIPLIIPTALSDEITRQGYRWIFRLNAPAELLTATLLDFIEQAEQSVAQSEMDGTLRLAIVFENTAYGTSVAEAAEREARARKMTVVAYQAYRAEATDFGALLQAVKAAQPHVVLFVSYDNAVALMLQSQAVDLNPRLFAAVGGGFSLPEFPRLAGAAAEYTISATPWTPDVKWPGVSDFAQRFKDAYGYLPQYHSAQTYAALQLAADALRRASSLSCQDIRDALRTTDLESISGRIQFDAGGQNNHTPLLTQIIDGQFFTVYPAELAAHAPVYPIPAWQQRATMSESGRTP